MEIQRTYTTKLIFFTSLNFKTHSEARINKMYWYLMSRATKGSMKKHRKARNEPIPNMEIDFLNKILV